jgi:hypothetical protein
VHFLSGGPIEPAAFALVVAAVFGRRGWSAVGILGLAALVVVGAYGRREWNRVRQDEFCVSCHSGEETLDRLGRTGHAALGCRDCHEQSTSASLRQVRWDVDRSQEVGPHAPVLPGTCAECHLTEDPDSTWQRISATVGHRVHLEADTSALQGVVCLTCHGEELHRFVPADATCGQSGCHDPGRTRIVLGDMAGQTGFHCVTCHRFTAPVAEEAPLDAVRGALGPSLAQCGSCHEMEKVLVGLDPRVDPHDAVCGTCHDPHTQEAPEEAAGRCAQCHAAPQTLTPMHRGIPAATLGDCVGCHEAHTFVLERDDCVACHAVDAGGIPTAGPVARDERPRRSPTGFDHAPHKDLQCIDCHASTQTHGQVSIRARGECQECHHSPPVVAAAGCARCHAREEIGAPRAVAARLDVAGRTLERTLGFDHDLHGRLDCTTCHGPGVQLQVTRSCASCHGEHHTASATCTTCHRPPPAGAHNQQVHSRGCAGSGCHEAASYGAMTEGRNTCIACHQDKVDHRPGQACAGCHRVSFAATASTAPGRR